MDAISINRGFLTKPGLNAIVDGQPVVSIIIPVYNTEKYLRQCLNSVLNQSFSNWECIVVDDGSTDGSGMICDEYGQMDNRFHIVHKQNDGVSTARNRGLDLAIGIYISFIDGDDFIESDFLEKMLSAMISCKVDIVCCKAIYSYQNREDQNAHYSIFSRKESIVEMLLPTSFHGWPWNKLYKAEIIDQYGIRFDETLKYCEDEVFVLQYLVHINTCCYLSNRLYHYVQNEMSANNKIYTQKKFDIRCLDRHKADDICASIIKGLHDVDLERAFQARLFDSYLATSDKLLATYNVEKDIWRLVRKKIRKYYWAHLRNKRFRRNLIIELKFLIRVISPMFYSKIFIK